MENNDEMGAVGMVSEDLERVVSSTPPTPSGARSTWGFSLIAFHASDNSGKCFYPDSSSGPSYRKFWR